MSNKVFISFRFADGNEYKEKLSDLFSNADDVINCSEDVDRSDMSEDTIQKYLYGKLKSSSVTIVLLTPQAVNHRKNIYEKYDDWMHDEIRYSLEDRENNRCNGLIAVYVPEAEPYVLSKTACFNCSERCSLDSIHQFDNLVSHNMMNVCDEYKTNKCVGVYDCNWDSYCSLVSWDEFINHHDDYIRIANEKRTMTYKYKIKKNLNL